MKSYILIFGLFMLSHWVFGQSANVNSRLITAKVIDTDQLPIVGANIKLSNTKVTAATNATGNFTLKADNILLRLFVSAIGYKTDTLIIQPNVSGPLTIVLTRSIEELKEVVIATGYQNIPKERATGSFIQIDKKLFNRRIGTDVLSRLEDVSPGLIYNRDGNAGNRGKSRLSIRGQSTINSNADPLIILNNFPFEGNILDINPNDVESVTLLKDAAASSIWGARAGNGVIVITTKQGLYNNRPNVTFNSNITLANKPDLFYQPQMSPSDFIDIEKKLFANGYYRTAELSNLKTALSPVVDLLIAKRDGVLEPDLADSRIEGLKAYDLRTDLSRYIYQKTINQQYALNLAGGSEWQKYSISAGYDRNRENLIKNGYSRSTLNAINSYLFFKKKLEVSMGLNFIHSHTKQNNAGYTSFQPYFPYTRLADEHGNFLLVNKNFNTTYLSSVSNKGLLDWNYNPLNELEMADNTLMSMNYRANATINYNLSEKLSVNVLYQFGYMDSQSENNQKQDTYFVRNLINSYTQTAAGVLTYPIPLGGMLDRTASLAKSHNLRGQLNYNNNWNIKHQVTAIAGYEISDIQTKTNINRLYGYDDEHEISKAVDYVTPYAQYYVPGTKLVIPNRDSRQYLTDRYLSYYSNIAYTYADRYTLSASARLDRSNIFGVKSNQKGVPLWSAGFAWNLSNESFYQVGWMPSLKLRATYGYSGNVFKNVSAYTTATYNPNAPNSLLPYAVVINPPNPELRWERVKMVNLGIDFNTTNSILSGTIEYYHKNGIDLIGLITTAPQTGLSNYTGNRASTVGDGIDVVLNSKNVDRQFKWNTAFFLSYVKDKVEQYDVKSSAIAYVQSLGGLPMQGKPLYAVYSFDWAGLDPLTGNPQGYLNGALSQNYSQIINAVKPDQLIFNGSARPIVFGALRNSFTWKGVQLSANISYRLGYYFRKRSVNYAGVLTAQGGHGDYSKRWQKQGDEASTQVPSLPSAIDVNRDNLYLYASSLALKGDHIRLQDININYDLPKKMFSKTSSAAVKLYLYANNIGLIWTANKFNIDPDYQMGQPPFSIAAGIKIDFN